MALTIQAQSSYVAGSPVPLPLPPGPPVRLDWDALLVCLDTLGWVERAGGSTAFVRGARSL